MASGSNSLSAAPPLPMGLRLNLSVMMFLQFAVWGAWFTVLGNRLAAMGLSDSIGSIFGTMALGSIFAPLFIGQIADRYFSSERLMAVLHLLGAGLLYWLAQIPPVPDPGTFALGAVGGGADFARFAPELLGNPAYKAAVDGTAWQFWGIALVYALVYSPTLALANAIAFTHVPDGERDFPGIRVLGTIGWIVAGLTVGNVLSSFVADPKTSNAPLLLAAALSAALAVYSLLLPHTPPKGQPGDALPFLRAVGLLKDFPFAVFFGASFIITIVLAAYYNYTGLYLEKRHGVEDVASLLTVGQFMEMLLLPLLPWFLYRFGMKAVLAVGMLAWGVRYALFAQADPFALVVVGIALHGICFDFFFAAGFIHVDKTAPPEIRGSAQALFTFLTYGVGLWLGSEFSNYLFNRYTPKAELGKDWVGFWGAAGQTDWYSFWIVPAVGVLVAFTIFVLFFRTRRPEPVEPKHDLEKASEVMGP